MPLIHCLRNTIQSGGQAYPVFVGFLPAAEILAVAEAPAFSDYTTHDGIANNILQPPIREWQRPLEGSRVNRIANVFQDTGEIMPNPVLLCQNVTLPTGGITVRQQQAVGGIPTNVWEIDLALPLPGAAKPLWILDGQHRINGMAKSKQSHNPLPLVLLLNQQLNAYNGPLLAKLFAQVTTSAAELDPLHHEWLTFAFRLGDYASTSPRGEAHQRAMEAVAEICRTPLVPAPGQAAGGTNPFLNNIRFNIHLPVKPAPGGFVYTCAELKELLLQHYYNAPTMATHLPPKALATELARAYIALSKSVAAPLDKTVFFGDAEHGQRIMQDAFIVGVCAHLLQHSPPTDWTTLLQTLNFSSTNWDFKSWVRSLSGSYQSVSKALAHEVMATTFRRQALPAGSSNLADFMRGNNASVEFEFSTLTPSNRPAKANKITLQVQRGAVQSRTIAPCGHIKLVKQTENIAKIQFIDKKSPPGRQIEYPEIKRGMILDSTKHSNPLSLVIVMQHYGGNESTAEVDISW